MATVPAALPFADTQINDPAVSSAVADLLRSEMLQMQEDGYTVAQVEEQVSTMDGGGHEPDSAMLGLDVERLKLPALGPEDVAESAIANDMAQIEHQRLRVLNAALIERFGPEKWRERRAFLKEMDAELREAVESEREAIASINAERASEQRRCAESLNALHHKWLALVARNVALERACSGLEQQLR